MTSFNYFTFFHADINQSELEESFQLASDCIESVRKNVKCKVVLPIPGGDSHLSLSKGNFTHFSIQLL